MIHNFNRCDNCSRTITENDDHYKVWESQGVLKLCASGVDYPPQTAQDACSRYCAQRIVSQWLSRTMKEVAA